MSIPDRILLDIALLEAAALLLTWVVILVGGIRSGRRRRREPRRVEARNALVRGTLSGAIDLAGRRVLASLPRRERIRLLEGLASNLRGREREWLGSLVEETDLMPYARRLSRSRLWWRRLRGARLLNLAGAAGMEVLRMADDPAPIVRGQVAEWCGDHPSDRSVATLVGMLDDPAQASRFAVQDALVRIGGPAVEPLADALAAATEQTAILTGLEVAEGIRDSRLAATAVAFTDHRSPAVRAAAFRVLGATGGRDAADRLERGLEDRDPAVRAAAATALGELGHWPSGPRLVRALEDRAWDVRFASGRALVRLGPPGELLLRRVMDTASNSFAADMARHAMDTAGVVTRFGGR